MREGGTPKADESTDKLRECDSDRGGGESKIPFFCGRQMYIPHEKKVWCSLQYQLDGMSLLF